MFLKVIGIIQNFFTKGHERSLKAKKNIISSFIIKGLNICLSLVLVPITIKYLDQTNYGIWITLSSIILWFGFFDIGLGHGLRNKYAQAIAEGDFNMARIYVSTTYFTLMFIVLIFLLLFYLINPFIDWNLILNVDKSFDTKVKLANVASIVITFFLLGFVLKLITTILIADQNPAKSSLFDLLGKVIALVIIYVLTKTTEGNLFYLCAVMSISPMVILLIANLWYFNGKYKNIKPSFNYFRLETIRELFGLGTKFFIIQIASILIYQTDNIVIAQLFGPKEVTPYNIAYRYFNIIVMVFSIIISPFWSAYTEAWVKKDYSWIKRNMLKLTRVWGFFVLLGIVMLSISGWVYRVWIGNNIKIPFILSGLFAIWVIINAWNGIFGSFLNGVGKIRLQMYIGFFGALINIPLAVILGKLIGIEGILYANILICFIGAVLYPFQYLKIIHHKATGLWNK